MSRLKTPPHVPSINPPPHSLYTHSLHSLETKETADNLRVSSSSEHSFLVRKTINDTNNNQVDTGLIQTKDVCMMQFACIATSKSRSPV